MYKLIIIFVLSFCCFLPGKLFSQLSTIEIYGTKSNGLGNVSTSFKDINSIYSNQAGLAFINGIEMNLGYENRFLTSELGGLYFGIAKNYKKIGTFALSIRKFGFSDYNEIQLGTAYAMKLNKNIAISMQINLFNISINEYGNKSKVSFDTGVLYDISKALTFGFHISNPFPIKFIENTEIPTIIALGLKYKVSDYLNLYCDVEKHIDYDFFIKSGIEYAPLNKFALYLGFKNNLNNYADYSMGLKYDFYKNIFVEFCTLYNLTLGMSPSIGLTYKM